MSVAEIVTYDDRFVVYNRRNGMYVEEPNDCGLVVYTKCAYDAAWYPWEVYARKFLLEHARENDPSGDFVLRRVSITVTVDDVEVA